MFISGHHIKSLQCRLNKRCTNNQAEQFAKLTGLKYNETLQTTDKTATVYTDSQITLDSLRNGNIHTNIIAEIRKELNEMMKTNWRVKFRWVKELAGIRGNKFPEKPKMKINLTQNFTTMVTGHRKSKAYLLRFKIIEASICPCCTRDQTTDHLLFECELLNKERNILKLSILKTEDWPTNKTYVIKKYIKEFTRFFNEIPFDKLNAA